MEDLIEKMIRGQLDALEPMLGAYEIRRDELSGFEDLRMTQSVRKGGRTSYYLRDGTNRRKYLGTEKSEIVQAVKELHYVDRSITIIRKNIMLLEQLRDGYESIDYEAINAGMPRLYRGSKFKAPVRQDDATRRWKEEMEAFKAEFNITHPDRYPQDLRVQAADGRWVRSKSEAMIADLANANGLTNIHELPHYCVDEWIRTDLTVLGPGLAERLFEHEGLMGDPKYQGKHLHIQVKYMEAGYKPNIDLFFTFDNLDGSFSLIPVLKMFDYIKGQ